MHPVQCFIFRICEVGGLAIVHNLEPAVYIRRFQIFVPSCYYSHFGPFCPKKAFVSVVALAFFLVYRLQNIDNLQGFLFQIFYIQKFGKIFSKKVKLVELPLGGKKTFPINLPIILSKK
jgi:hypothetical protein